MTQPNPQNLLTFTSTLLQSRPSLDIPTTQHLTHPPRPKQKRLDNTRHTPPATKVSTIKLPGRVRQPLCYPFLARNLPRPFPLDSLFTSRREPRQQFESHSSHQTINIQWYTTSMYRLQLVGLSTLFFHRPIFIRRRKTCRLASLHDGST